MILLPMSELDVADVYGIERTVSSFPWSLQQCADSLRKGDQCTVAWEGNCIVGFTIFSSVLDEATLQNIAVKPAYQSRGCGRKLLLDGLLSLSQQGVLMCFLEVRIGNYKAQSLYCSMGFAEVGKRKNYYPALDAREDALVMSRPLPTKQLGEI